MSNILDEVLAANETYVAALIWTHKIRGLTESDFYFAAKVDRAFKASNEG